MKTAEELLKEKGITPETVYHNYVYVYRAACDLIGEAQKEAYNQAIEAMRWRDPKEELPEKAGCDSCRDEQGYTIGNMYVCDKCGRQVP